MKVNFKIYTLRFVTEQVLAPYLSKIRAIEIEKESTISFNFEDQYFQIESNDQTKCKEVCDTINNSLIFLLNSDVEGCFEGTFQEVSSLEPLVITKKVSETSIDNKIFIGQPLDFTKDKDLEAEEKDCGYTLEDLNHVPQIVMKRFEISPFIAKIKDFLMGPPQHNMQLAEYIHIVPKLTNTECAVNRSCIVISGEENHVEDAYNIFKVLQNTYIANFRLARTLCIHYPSIAGHFGLYFCNLSRYRHQSFVCSPYDIENVHVMLPVFPDFFGEYAFPKDRINIHHTQQKQPPPLQSIPILEKKEDSSIKALKMPSTPKPTRYTSAPHKIINPREERNTISTTSITEPINTIASNNTINNNTTADTPASVMEFTIPEIPQLNAFPALPPSRPVSPIVNVKNSKRLFLPRLGTTKPRVNRVMRIDPQKSTSSTNLQSAFSIANSLKNYNYDNIKNTLTHTLDSLRGFKGEVKLSARLGKVVWNNVNSKIEGRIWNFQDINDIVIKELGVKPQFINVATTDDQIIDQMTSESVLGHGKPYRKSAIYEFHCSARNSPQLPYKKNIVHMNQGVIDVRKVIWKERTAAEVNWVSLDRKFDFQFSIATKTLLRQQVKPYTTFIKKVSICPITRLMTFENVPDFLSVDYVLLRQTSKYRIAFPFIVGITRVEKVPISPVPKTKKINAAPGTGEVWYEYEVEHSTSDTVFEANLNLEVGEEASWTSADILGQNSDDEDSSDTIGDYVKVMLTLVERIEKSIEYAAATGVFL